MNAGLCRRGHGITWASGIERSEPSASFGQDSRTRPPTAGANRLTADSSSRREFLKAAVSAAAGPALAIPAVRTLAGAPLVDDVPIVDAHQHLWDLDQFHLPWVADYPTLNRSFVMADYLKAVAGLNVVKAVYMEVDVHPSQQVKEAEYVIELCKRDDNPTVAAVISGRPNTAQFEDYIVRYKDSPYIKGVRQVLHPPTVPRGLCLEPQFIRSVRLLGELGMSYDLVMRNDELDDGAKLCALCPDTRFILDHCGNGDVQSKDRTAWKRGLAAVARQKNCICKISGIVASAKPGEWTAEDLAPIITFTLDQFGPERVIFAGDWPVCTLAATFREWVTALKQIVADRPTSEQRKLFHDNAVQFYGL
jgi:L-fuconolactonase